MPKAVLCLPPTSRLLPLDGLNVTQAVELKCSQKHYSYPYRNQYRISAAKISVACISLQSYSLAPVSSTNIGKRCSAVSIHVDGASNKWNFRTILNLSGDTRISSDPKNVPLNYIKKCVK